MALWKAVGQGVVVTRANTERKFGSADHYEFVWAERHGKMCLFAFTKLELDEAQTRAVANVEDMPVLRRKRWFNW